MDEIVIGFKLVRMRADGTLGPLFINRKQVFPMNEFMVAEDHKTPGFEHRPGFHACLKPEAPHLKKAPKSGENRVWVKVALEETTKYDRPESQGGTWVLAHRMMILEVIG